MSKDKKLIFSRREYISALGSSAALVAYHTTPFGQLLRNIVRGAINDAHAQEMGMLVKNHIAIIHGGAPPQWPTYSFLIPDANSGYVHNNSVGNAIVGSTYAGNGTSFQKSVSGNVPTNEKVRYITEKVTLNKGMGSKEFSIYLPAIWGQTIPTSSGEFIEMSSILQNAMMMRGVDMLIDLQHQVGPQRMIQPDLNKPSISGVVADLSQKMLPAISNKEKLYGFMAPSGMSPVVVQSNGSGNVIANVLGPFSEPSESSSSSTNRAVMEAVVKEALKELEAYRKSRKPGSSVIYENNRKAEEMLKKNFGDFNAEYATLKNKYVNLAKGCATPIENITLNHNDIQVVNPKGGFDAPGTQYSILPANAVDPNGSNLSHYGEQGALIEFLIKHQLSSSITISGAGSHTGKFSITSDEHALTNRQASAISWSFNGRNTMAFLNELKKVAIQYNQWEDTVIQIGSEYGRRPANSALKDSGGGSDHATKAGWSFVFSGAIKEPIFVGNIKINTQPKENGNMGTWGSNAPTKIEGTNESISIDINHMAKAITDILEVECPIRNVKSILTNDNGVWKSILEKPKNTDG